MTVTLEDAAPRFAELVRLVQSGDEVIITDGDKAIARISLPLLGSSEANVTDATPPLPPRQPGSAKGVILYMSDDFDAPLDDFADYMYSSRSHAV